MHNGMPYGRIQGQGHSREVDRQSPTGLIFMYNFAYVFRACRHHSTKSAKWGGGGGI